VALGDQAGQELGLVLQVVNVRLSAVMAAA
jgi:hypothetical protein